MPEVFNKHDFSAFTTYRNPLDVNLCLDSIIVQSKPWLNVAPQSPSTPPSIKIWALLLALGFVVILRDHHFTSRRTPIYQDCMHHV